MKNILLNILALGAILSSILVITSKNPVISVLYLISLFINTAGYLILLGISFVGIAYILVYIGAITVLFLFVIMMINIKLVDILEVGKEYTKNLPLALSIGFLFLYLIMAIISFNSYGVLNEGTTGLNNILLQILNSPLETLTNFNKLFLVFGGTLCPTMPSGTLINDYANINLPEHGWTIFRLGGVDYLNDSISWQLVHNFITIINSVLNPIGIDMNFVNFLHIEMLGQGLYTYGAYWLILSSIILLLSMIAPIILSTPATSLKEDNKTSQP